MARREPQDLFRDIAASLGVFHLSPRPSRSTKGVTTMHSPPVSSHTHEDDKEKEKHQ